MLAVGAASLVTGAVLFLAPTLVIPVWAWDLTPLTAQVIGAVLSLPGVVAIGFLRDDRWSSFRVLFQAQLVSLVAIVCSLIAGRDALHWDRPATPAFLALIGVAFVGYLTLTVAMECGCACVAAATRRHDRAAPDGTRRAALRLPGGRYLTCSTLPRASSVSSTVRSTAVSNELIAPPLLIASATAAIDTLSGASHRV